MKSVLQNRKKRCVRSAKFVARAGVTAGLYVLFSLVVMPLAFGPVQIRFGEAFAILPCLMPEAIPGLAIGCLIVNLFSPFGWYDIVFGTLVTLFSALLTRCLKKVPPAATLPPILLNAFILPLMWLLMGVETIYWFNVGTVTAGQAIAVIGLGLPLFYALKPFKKMYAN